MVASLGLLNPQVLSLDTVLLKGGRSALDLVYPSRPYCRMQRREEKPSFQLIFLPSAQVQPDELTGTSYVRIRRHLLAVVPTGKYENPCMLPPHWIIS